MTDRSGSQIDHLNVAVPDLDAAVAFYEPVLATLGIVRILTIPAFPGQYAMVGFGWAEVKPFFWLLEKGVVGTGCTWPSRPATAARWTHSTGLHWRRARSKNSLPPSTPSTTPIITAAS
ncbi:hypothetical protein JL107_17650 [Nakamurella flavida]|uniref:VOC domain-containing protein n=1 Tax=Nakamurella flavida TaxID=363630 RepID=A0A939C4N3_9ACTN|nr:hypothetical protein [Nakamurella flavida]MBM9478276.1 hypothetical protein [Nakamurella flavida]MDP9777553.1 catechol 2,3-dioxygenase-like lactoylglutathione lyase family enzyme [Nakamurella flavida]